MISPEPEFYVVHVVQLSVEPHFRVEAVFTRKDDADEHVKELRESKNYLGVSGPHKELMSSVLDRLLKQKLNALAPSGASEVVLKFGE